VPVALRAPAALLMRIFIEPSVLVVVESTGDAGIASTLVKSSKG
jgi:hypothetical protein